MSRSVHLSAAYWKIALRPVRFAHIDLFTKQAKKKSSFLFSLSAQSACEEGRNTLLLFVATRYNTAMKRILEVEMGITMAILFLASLGAYFFYWYSTIWWFDMPMHFTGGYFLSIMLMYIVVRAQSKGNSEDNKKINPKYPLEKPTSRAGLYLKLILLTFTIGFLWEVYEFAVDTYFNAHLFVFLDSFSDLCFDMAGAITALFFIDRHML